MRSLSVRGDWQRYKRYSDNVVLYGRLVEVDGRKFIQVREKREGDQVVCPHCQTVLSEAGGIEVPDALLSPEVFHKRHKPKTSDT